MFFPPKLNCLMQRGFWSMGDAFGKNSSLPFWSWNESNIAQKRNVRFGSKTLRPKYLFSHGLQAGLDVILLADSSFYVSSSPLYDVASSWNEILPPSWGVMEKLTMMAKITLFFFFLNSDVRTFLCPNCNSVVNWKHILNAQNMFASG